MHMLYNSDSYVVVAFELPSAPASGNDAAPALTRGGYEIVDKFARKEIFIEGALAEQFQQGVQALVAQGEQTQDGAASASMEEALDDFIAGYTVLAQQPVTLH